jgi:hypothetical protein
MKSKIRLVTVTGSRTNTLWHMLNHYKDLVDEMYVVVYEWDKMDTYDEVKKIVSEFGNASIVLRETHEKYNWETVTKLYNRIKGIHPNDWWVVSDDDEFHLYSLPLKTIIKDCEDNGWEIVRGGFVDRIGKDGEFVEILDKEDIFKQFPYAGFFRYQLSGACPNKICIVKGDIEITSGQHYAKIDGHTTWKWQGWRHPLIAPIDKYNVQVHHFKWDKSCIDRIKAVADEKKDYSYSSEYEKMYKALRRNGFKIDLENPNYMFSKVEHKNYTYYKNWKKLFNKIVSI